jgi:hypothetical protein
VGVFAFAWAITATGATTLAAVALAFVMDATTDTVCGTTLELTTLGTVDPTGNACAFSFLNVVKSDADGLRSGIVKNEGKKFSEEE